MKVKIELENNETPEEADDLLEKALKAKREKQLTHEAFDNPKTQKLASEMEALFENTQKQILKEIEELLK